MAGRFKPYGADKRRKEEARRVRQEEKRRRRQHRGGTEEAAAPGSGPEGESPAGPSKKSEESGPAPA